MEQQLLNSHPPLGTTRSNRLGGQPFVERGLLAQHHSCSLKGRLLIKHTSKAHDKPFQKFWTGSEVFSFCRAPRLQYLLEGSFYTRLLLLFLWLQPKRYPLTACLQKPGEGGWVPRSHRTVTVGHPPPPRVLLRQPTKTHPSLPVKEASLPLLELCPRGRVLV